MGMHGEAWVNTAIQEADLLIALGMRFDDRVTGNLKTYARNAKKIHVDIDAAEINKNVVADVGIVGDRRRCSAWLPSFGGPISPTGSRASTSSRVTRPSVTFRTCRTTAGSMPRTSFTICGGRPAVKRSS